MHARGWSLAVLLIASCGGTITTYERQGDRARAQGDNKTAAENYEHAMAKRPIMDFDYERVRDKRLHVVGEQLKPKVSKAVGGDRGDPISYLSELLRTRREARDAHGAAADLKQIETAVAAACDADKLAGSSAAPADPVGPLLALLDTALTTKAPQKSLDAILAAIRKRLAAPYAPPAGTGLVALGTLIGYRITIRQHQLPADLDHAIDPMLMSLGMGRAVWRSRVRQW